MSKKIQAELFIYHDGNGQIRPEKDFEIVIFRDEQERIDYLPTCEDLVCHISLEAMFKGLSHAVKML